MPAPRRAFHRPPSDRCPEVGSVDHCGGTVRGSGGPYRCGVGRRQPFDRPSAHAEGRKQRGGLRPAGGAPKLAQHAKFVEASFFQQLAHLLAARAAGAEQRCVAKTCHGLADSPGHQSVADRVHDDAGVAHVGQASSQMSDVEMPIAELKGHGGRRDDGANHHPCRTQHTMRRSAAAIEPVVDEKSKKTLRLGACVSEYQCLVDRLMPRHLGGLGARSIETSNPGGLRGHAGWGRPGIPDTQKRL